MPSDSNNSNMPQNKSYFETARTRRVLPTIFPFVHWRSPARDRYVYLTFDDGPTPHVTDTILQILESFKVKATFFCIGKQAMAYPTLLQNIVNAGHALGNHTQSHIAAWETSNSLYTRDIAQCDEALSEVVALESGFLSPFRPPFGQLTFNSGWKLARQRPVVMWDVNSMDYREDESVATVTKRVTENVRPGSIVLMHDSFLAAPRTLEALPKILTTLFEQGYRLDQELQWYRNQNGKVSSNTI